MLGDRILQKKQNFLLLWLSVFASLSNMAPKNILGLPDAEMTNTDTLVRLETKMDKLGLVLSAVVVNEILTWALRTTWNHCLGFAWKRGTVAENWQRMAQRRHMSTTASLLQRWILRCGICWQSKTSALVQPTWCKRDVLQAYEYSCSWKSNCERGVHPSTCSGRLYGFQVS